MHQLATFEENNDISVNDSLETYFTPVFTSVKRLIFDGTTKYQNVPIGTEILAMGVLTTLGILDHSPLRPEFCDVHGS